MAIAIAQYTIKDLNDITTSSTAPSNPTANQLWLDTSATPNLLKKWDGSSWTKTGASSLSQLDPTAYTTLNSQGSSISTIQGQISSKVWSTDITTAVNAVTTGTRNYVRKYTYDTYTGYTNTTWSGATNQTYTPWRLYIDTTWQVGDIISVQIKYTLSNIAWSGGAFSLWIQGAGNVTGWTTSLTTPTSSGSATIVNNSATSGSGFSQSGAVLFRIKATAAWLSNAYFEVGYRANYVSSGSMTLYEACAEKTTQTVDYTPAPEDTQAQINSINTNITTNYSTTAQTNSLISSQVGSVSTDLHTNYSTTVAMNSAITQSKNDVTLAVSQTYATQTAVNGKSTVFSSQPTPPYIVGDLWVGTTPTGSNMICTTARSSGSYTASDWAQDSVTQRMSSAESKITPTAITSTVASNITGNQLTSVINQTATSVQISAGKIDLNGIVTAVNNGTTTKINGSAIVTGSITATQINASNLSVYSLTAYNGSTAITSNKAIMDTSSSGGMHLYNSYFGSAPFLNLTSEFEGMAPIIWGNENLVLAADDLFDTSSPYIWISRTITNIPADSVFIASGSAGANASIKVSPDGLELNATAISLNGDDCMLVGTWTPEKVANMTITAGGGNFIQIGKIVYVSGWFTGHAASSTGGTCIISLPVPPTASNWTINVGYSNLAMATSTWTKFDFVTVTGSNAGMKCTYWSGGRSWNGDCGLSTTSGTCYFSGCYYAG